MKTFDFCVALGSRNSQQRELTKWTSGKNGLGRTDHKNLQLPQQCRLGIGVPFRNGCCDIPAKRGRLALAKGSRWRRELKSYCVAVDDDYSKRPRRRKPWSESQFKTADLSDVCSNAPLQHGFST